MPDFEGIRVHVLNWAHESEGCIGVGKTKGKNIISHSRTAFAEFTAALDAALSDGGFASLIITNKEQEEIRRNENIL
ncbi:MAG TPA: hypothetical protein ENN95_00570 [Deltaproteobacteria bacterium]|nr:hypothetical protein [Deltaproteobacteria bacterium]